MSLVKRNNELRPYYSNFFDDFFNTGFWPTANLRREVPALNVKEDEHSLTLELQVPGMKKEDIKLEYRDGFLTISGEQKEEREEKEKEKFLRREFSSFSFRRTVELPEEKYDVNRAEASYHDGILDITMPKNEERAKLSKTIQVK